MLLIQQSLIQQFVLLSLLVDLLSHSFIQSFVSRFLLDCCFSLLVCSFFFDFLFFSLFSVFLGLRSYNVIDLVVCSFVSASWSSFSFFYLVSLVLGSYQVVVLICSYVSDFWFSFSLVFLILGSLQVFILVVCSFVQSCYLIFSFYSLSYSMFLLGYCFSVLFFSYAFWSSFTLVQSLQFCHFSLSYSGFLLGYCFSGIFFCLSYWSSFSLSLVFLILGSYQIIVLAICSSLLSYWSSFSLSLIFLILGSHQVIILVVYSFVSCIWSSFFLFFLLFSKFSLSCFVSDQLQLVVICLLDFLGYSDG